MLFRSLLLISILTLLVSCGTTQSTSQHQTDDYVGTNTLKADKTHDGLDLTSYLSRLQGVMVSGRGPGASIQVRLPVSLRGGSDPLFVIDGSIIGQDYSTVYGSVDVNSIDQVTVLKTAMELTRYGMRGANGVIEIVTKK